MSMYSFLSSLLSEKKCYSCHKPWHFFCPLCNDKVEKYSPYCYVCKKYSPDFSVHNSCRDNFPLSEVIVLSHYRNSIMKKLLRVWKYSWKYRVYEDIIMNNRDFFRNSINTHNAILVPIPIHFIRRWKRWYNQTEKIAHALQGILDIPVNNKLLYRTKYTKQQSHLSYEIRQKNLLNSFWVHKNKWDTNVTLYLIDDVISTASTLLEASKVLQKSGFTDIRAIVLASD